MPAARRKTSEIKKPIAKKPAAARRKPPPPPPRPIRQQPQDNPGDFRSGIEMLTPERAQELFDNRAPNRNVIPALVVSLRENIRYNRWLMNPGFIHIGADGLLYDGQNRCKAIAEEGVSVIVGILYGGGLRNQDITDDGKKRKASGALTIHGYKNATIVANVCRHVIVYERTGFPEPARGGGGNFLISNPEISEVAGELHPLIKDSVEFVTGLNMRSVIAPGIAATIHYLAGRGDNPTQFFESLSKGADLESDSPILALRNKLLSSKQERKSTGQFERAYSTFCWTIRAYNAYCTGGQIKRFPAPTGPPPVIHGCVVKRHGE